MAWLVYRGEMVSSSQAHQQALSFWLMDALGAEASTQHRSADFQAELLLESVRASRHPSAVSRLRGFYVFDTQESAEAAAASWGPGFRLDTLAEVGIVDGSTWSRHDAEWITTRFRGPDPTWIDAYLRGDAAGPQPTWELLVDGRAVIYGTELRQAAYEVVKQTWPDSLALLELSRVGAVLDSDLGLITPIVHGEAQSQRVDFMMNFVDAEQPEFLARFAAYDGPKNTADLNDKSDLVLPDLTAQGFSLTGAGL